MRIKSCGPLKKRKEKNIPMESENVLPIWDVRKSLLKQYNITGNTIENMTEKALQDLLNTLLKDTWAVMMALARRDGLRTSHISTTKERKNDPKKSIK